MEFDQFLDICGRSVFAEEYRGDFDVAWEFLQEEPTDLSVGPEQAELLRCKSIYAILTGRLKDAYDNLHLLHGLLNQLPQEWGLRYTNYLLMADWTRRFPPSLRFYHESGLPRNVSMVGDMVGPDDFSQNFMANVRQYLPTGISQDQGFCQILNAVQLSIPHLTRHLTSIYHPLSPSGSLHQPDANPTPFIAEMSKSLVNFKEIADANGATSIASYLDRLLVEFHLTCQRPSAATDLEKLYSRYETKGDLAGMANCKIMEGDSLMSPPFASPLSLNLVITDSSSAIAEHAVWDPVEVDLVFEYSTSAQECYDSALNLFQGAKCKRGQAAVLLRQACCLHTTARHQSTKKGINMEILENADGKLQDAFELFGKDEANMQLVKAHQILVSISRGNTHVKVIAREIGQWCADFKNEQLGHFIGLLLSRYGRQEWFQFSRMDTALLAWDCAFEISNILGDMVPKFQATVSRAWVHNEMFNSAAARVFLGDALAMVDEVSEYYETRIQAAPDTPMGKMDRTSLQIAKFNTLWTFSRKVSIIYLRVEDLPAFEKWQEKLVYWIQHDDSFREFRERLQENHDLTSTHLEVAYVPKNMKYLWQKTMADDEVKVKSAAADITYRRHLEEGDVDKAEERLHLFVDQAGDMPKVYTRDLYRILACERMGDLTMARDILDNIDDNSLFNDCLEDFQQGIAVRSIFHTIAENALTFTVFGGDYVRAYRLIGLITEISPSFFDHLNENSLDHSFRLGYYSAIMMHNSCPEVAFSRLIQVQQAIELRRTQIADVDARIGSSWAGWTCEVFINLAILCLRCSDARIPVAVVASYDHGHATDVSWAEHALLFSESSRARAVLESLQTQASSGHSADSRTASLSEAVYKRRTLRTLRSLPRRSPEQDEEILHLEQDITNLESEEELSSATTFIDNSNATLHPRLLYQCIDKNAVVIEATFGPRGCIVFAVTREGIQQYHQGSTRTVDIRRPVMKIMQIMKEMTGYRSEEEESRKRNLNKLSHSVSAELLDPFKEIIKSKTHIIFSVSDPLTAFPFSILPFNNEPLIKHAAISQVPSLTVLYYLSQRKPSQGRLTVSVFAKSPTEESSTATRPNKEVNLHMAGIEAINIARLFSTWPIEASHLTRQAFREHVEGESLIMHIGTHGDINHRNPLLSSISIGQGQDFRVLDMSAIRSKVSLLVFAACLSGLGKATIGSEVLGFSHVVLSTGCQANIGTLWKVSDFASMLIMTLFYRLLRDEMCSVAEVMRRAQLEFLGLNGEKVALLLDDMLENWTAPGQQGHSPAEFVPDAQFLLLTLKMILDQLDWSSPFYWAPFTLMGFGDFRFSPAPA
jgi:CHAT domain-containing protein